MDLAGPAQNIGREYMRTQASVVGHSLLTAAGTTAATVGAGMLIWGSSPIWGTALVVVGAGAALYGGYKMLSSLF